MLTATLPGSNVLQNTFCCLLLAVLWLKNAVKNILEIKREKTIAMISNAKKEKRLDIVCLLMNKPAMKCSWPKSLISLTKPWSGTEQLIKYPPAAPGLSNNKNVLC